MTNNAPDTATPAVDLRVIFRSLMRRKLLLFLPWSAAVLAGVAAALLLKPVYFSEVTLLLERGQNLSGPLGGMVGGGNPEQQAEVMREQVQSSIFLRSVISATGIKADARTRQWAADEGKKYKSLGPEERIDAFLVDYLRKATSIRRGKGNVFTITVADYRPDRARKIAEGVANQFVISSKAAQLEAVMATQQFSAEQQKLYKRKLEESEQRLEAARRAGLSSQLGSGAAVTETNALRARSQLEQAGLEIDEQQQRVASLKSQLRGRTRENDPAQLSSPETNAMGGALNGLERQLAAAQLISEPGGDNGGAARQSIARKVAELEQQFTKNAAIAFPNLSADTRDLLVRYRLATSDLQAKEAGRAYLSSQVGSYVGRTVSAPDRDLEIQRLSQEVESNRAFYNSFLQQSAAAQIAEAFENAKVSGRFVILEPATLPLSPSKPNRPMLVLLGLVLGGIISVGSVMVVEHHDQSMRNAEEVESILGLPVVGAVPRVAELERSRRRRGNASAPSPTSPKAPGQRDPGLLHRLKVESPLGLEFRRIYLKLAKSRGKQFPHTLLVTSSTRGEGKTTTSACLGITFAREMREKVLLVDFDLRSPALHRALGMPTSSWGLAQMLAQQKFDERFVRSTVLPELFFLPAGKSERPAAELLDSDAIEWFIQEARSRYSMVVLDSAPCLAVPDPLIIGRAVEGVLYVVKAGHTIRKAAEYGVRVQREAKDNVLGVLMNDAGEVLPHYYGYHDAYGYTPEVAGGES